MTEVGVVLIEAVFCSQNEVSVWLSNSYIDNLKEDFRVQKGTSISNIFAVKLVLLQIESHTLKKNS